jgi:hypothetical protein
MRDDEIQIIAQRRLQEFEDALESTDADFVELGQRCVAALEEFINHWNKRLASPESGPQISHSPDDETAAEELRRYIERQLDWAQSHKEKMLSMLSGVRNSK